MERLPDEVLCGVLARLPLRDLLAAARVSRRWAAAARLLVLRAPHRRPRRPHAARRLLLLRASLPLPRLLALTPALTELTVHARLPLDAAALLALAHLPHLTHLDVFVRGRVLRAEAPLATLRLDVLVINEAAAPGVLRALARGGTLRQLHMYGRARHYPPRELGALLRARADLLTELTLRCTELTTRDYEAVGACRALLALRLYSCWLLTGAGARHVARLRRLRVLHVSGARPLWPRPLAAFIAELPPALEELVLSAGRFGDEHAVVLGARLPALRVLELWRCPLSAAGVAAAAGALPRLRELDVDTALSAAAVRRLATHPALRRLRCERAADTTVEEWRAAAGQRLQLRPAGDAGRRRRRRRGDGEGPRADRYYSWESADRGPEPTSGRRAELSDSDTDDDGSLLGTCSDLDNDDTYADEDTEPL